MAYNKWHIKVRHKTLPYTSHRPQRVKRVGQLMEKAMGNGLKKRGFANADLVAHWPHIIPPPYDQCTLPEKLIWPRTPTVDDALCAQGHSGAILMLQVSQAQKLAVDYEKDAIRRAINAYFGFELVGQIKLSKYPFHRPAPPTVVAHKPTQKQIEDVHQITQSVHDKNLRDALNRLGQNLAAKNT